MLQSMGLQRVDWVTDQQQYKGERSEKEYITESLCCIPETNTVLYINYTSVKGLKSQRLKRQKVRVGLF